MLSAESFRTASLRRTPEGESITRILAASIRAVEPGAAVERFVRRSGDILNVAGRNYDLADFGSVSLLGDRQSRGCDEHRRWPGSLDTRLHDVAGHYQTFCQCPPVSHLPFSQGTPCSGRAQPGSREKSD